MLTDEGPVARAGLDAVAVKPTEHDLRRARELPVDDIVVDYEGPEAFPSRELLGELAADRTVYVTTPVRADGFDPLGDDARLPLPAGLRRVLVAGHPAYLDAAERTRAVAPRLRAARKVAPDAWVGTESVERIALAAGGTQYELLAPGTARQVRSLRAAGLEEDVAVYAPVVLSDDEDAILDAVGEYAARRDRVRRALPDGAATDAAAAGREREVLSGAVRDHGLVGTVDDVREQVATLREAGVDRVVGYPARGLDEFLCGGVGSVEGADEGSTATSDSSAAQD